MYSISNLLATNDDGKCKVRQFMEAAKISHGTARKAIDFYQNGKIELKRQGHGKSAVG